MKKKITPAIALLALLSVAACSSSWGEGSPSPSRTTVVVPPNSTTSTTNQ